MKNWQIFLACLFMGAVVFSATGASCGWAQGSGERSLCTSWFAFSFQFLRSIQLKK